MIFRTALILLMSCIAIASFAQSKPTPLAPITAKDFFIPTAGKNKTVLFTPDQAGKKTNDGRIIYYVFMGSNAPAPDTAKAKAPDTKVATDAKSTAVKQSKPEIPNVTLKYQVLDMNMYGEQVTGTEKQFIEVMPLEVKITQSIFNNLLDKNKPITYDPPATLLKVPKTGQKAQWTYTDRTHRDYKCTAEWASTMIIDGQKKRALKVTTEPSVENKRIGKTMSYYVEGYGLWKTEYIDPKGAKQVIDQFEKLDYDYTVPNN